MKIKKIMPRTSISVVEKLMHINSSNVHGEVEKHVQEKKRK